MPSLKSLAFAFPVVPTPQPHQPSSTPPSSSAPPPSSTPPPSSPSDDFFLRRCVQLALKAAGQTRPNPPVGCVITDATGNRILGEGYHRRAGYPHAEVNALRNVRDNGHSDQALQGATVYVSLEPCNHYGRTPPCAKALVDARVARVVVGTQDPDERTSGGGILRMRQHGIHVDVLNSNHVINELVTKSLEGFISRIERKRPFGLLKYAMTLDGKIATENGSSKWITGENARQRVHEVRASVDAIVVGGETLRKDDPLLTPRGVCFDGGLRPIRVVMTRKLSNIWPSERKLWDVAEAETVVFVRDLDKDGSDKMIEELKVKGVDVVHEPDLGPMHVMKYLYERGCLTVLWECGGSLAAQAIRQGAIDKVMAFIAPKIIGGRDAPSPVGSPAVQVDMTDALVLRDRKIETFDNGDILISGYVQ